MKEPIKKPNKEPTKELTKEEITNILQKATTTKDNLTKKDPSSTMELLVTSLLTFSENTIDLCENLLYHKKNKENKENKENKGE